MTVDIDINVSENKIRAIPIPLTSVDVQPIQGPCTLLGWSIREASGEGPGSANGTVTSPAALQAIASTASLPPGTYTVSWTVTLSGTLGAGDANNFQLVDSAGVVVASTNAAAAGSYPQNVVQVTTTLAGAFTVRANGVGTVGAVYGAQLTVTPTLGTAAIVEFQDGGVPLGESALQAGGSDTQLMFDDGIHVSNVVNVHIVKGTVVGALYAQYDKQS